MEISSTAISLGLAFGSLILSGGISWGVAITKSKNIETDVSRVIKKYDSILLAPDGQLNFVPVTLCASKQSACQAQAEKDRICIVKKIEELKAMVTGADTKRELAREEQIKHQQKVEIHMVAVAEFIKNHNHSAAG